MNRNRVENGRDRKRGEIEQVRFVLEVERNFVITRLEWLDANDDEDSLERKKNQWICHYSECECIYSVPTRMRRCGEHK